MTTSTTPAVAGSETNRPQRAPRKRGGNETFRHQALMGRIFVGPYTALLLLFGLGPTLYALYLAFTDGSGFAGFDNFIGVFQDYRFLPALTNVASFLALWLVVQTVFVVILALLVHQMAFRWLSTTARFVYYIPGAFAGAASVMVWLFLLDPSVSPVAGLLRSLGFDSFVQTVAQGNLPVIFMIIAFWTGAGQWIVIMYGALNGINTEVLEAARVDGANMFQIAWRVQIPLLRRWIAYMGVMCLAGGAQLFVEPRVLSQASKSVVPEDYSLNQLVYLYAFRQGDFNGSAALSISLLVVTLLLASIFVFKGGLFDRE